MTFRLGQGTLERDARRLAPLVATVWRRLAQAVGAYFGEVIGPGLELRALPDADAAGAPVLTAGGSQQVRYGLFARGQTGIPGVALLTGTAAEPETSALLLLAPAPASAAASGTPGEIRFDDGYLYCCVAPDTWKRVELATWP